MWTALALACLAGCGLSLVPIPLRVTFRWDGDSVPRWSLVLRIAGFALLDLPDRNAPRRESEPEEFSMPPWLDALVDWTLAQWRKHRSRAKTESGTKKSGGFDLFDLLERLFLGLFVRPTRRVRLDVAGIDPAALAAMYGAFLSVQPLLPGGDIFRLRPEWDATRPRVRFLWAMRTSLAGLIGGILYPKRRS